MPDRREAAKVALSLAATAVMLALVVGAELVSLPAQLVVAGARRVRGE